MLKETQQEDPAVAEPGGGHGYVQNWQSGTGIVYGASGGGTNLTREITGLRGDNDSATPTSLTIAGAGTVKVGVDGQIGNNTSTVTPATASYEVGAGAGGVLVMGPCPQDPKLEPTSTRWRTMDPYPGSRDKFEAPIHLHKIKLMLTKVVHLLFVLQII